MSAIFKPVSRSLSLLVLAILLVTNGTAKSIAPPNQPHKSFVIISEKLMDTLSIEVILPQGYGENPNKMYNSMYVLDAHYFFDADEGTLDFLLERGEGMTNIVKKLTDSKDIPPTILIGIGYTERQRHSFTMGKVDAFHAFFREDLIPRIESEFRASKKPYDRLLFGYSASAHFSTYVLLNDARYKTDTFGKFISISGVYGTKTETYKLEEDLAKAEDTELLSGKSLFIGIGGLDAKLALLKAHREFVKKLVDRKYKGVNLRSTEFQNHGHYDVPEFAFEEGLKWIFRE